jgi:hypothetical protein
MKTSLVNESQWSENIIIADADYIDHVAFDLIVNFERMLMRRIPQADLPIWAECIALDGGMRPDEGVRSSGVRSSGVQESGVQESGVQEFRGTNVVLIHDKERTALENFQPAKYDEELNGQAFKGPLGEFAINTVAVDETTTKTQLLLEVVALACSHKDVKRIMIVPNAEEGTTYDELRQLLRNADDEKRITVFAMQPLQGGNFRQEILGYSMMQALGIKGEEFN